MIRYGVFLLWISSLTVSCGEPVGGSGTSPVFLIAHGEDKWGMIVDVYDPSIKGYVADDYFDITIESIYKGEGANPLIQTEFAEVIIQEYRVTYYRLDGNPNVPDPFTIQIMSRIAPGSSGKINTLVLRRDAKLKSPLKELVFGGGEGYIEFNVIVEFFGEDMLGNHVSTKYVMSINASDT